MHPLRPSVTFDGTESIEGRALLVVSALYWGLDWARRVRLHFVDVTDANVATALAVFERDTGVAVGHEAGCRDESFDGSVLYAGIAFRDPGHMRFAMARAHAVPVVVPIQYPAAAWLGASALLHRDAAFDPRRFAGHVGRLLGALA